jgi:DNA-directed RNA polymerase
MSDEGVARYHKKITDAKSREAESATSYGQRLLSASIIPFAESIRAWLKEHTKARAGGRITAVKPLSQLTPEVVAFITTRTVLDNIALSRGYGSICQSLGAAIDDELRFAWLRKHHPGLFKKLERQLNACPSYEHKRTVIVYAMNKAGISAKPKDGAEGLFEPSLPALHVKVGAVLLDLFEKSTQMVEVVQIREGHKLRSIVQATAKTTEWIRGYNEYAEVLDPVWLPMVELPADWVAPSGGGYTSELLPLLSLVKRAGARYINETLPTAVMPEVYACLNALQRTGWRVNRKVYGVMQHLWDTGRKVGGLPQSSDDELPTKPLDIATNEDARKEWKRKAARVHTNNAALRSTRLQARKLLNLAQKFANVEKFHFPYQLDFRGRIYTVPTFLTPQGSDLARGLLTFSDTATLNNDDDAYWLGVYGANLFGKDKITFEERLAWVHSQRENILRVASDPLGFQWWQEADEPWQFLAWCFEWSGWLTQGSGFLTSFPVCLDGTNNGLQILSMLTRDEAAAKATNVLPSAKPEDIYGEVALNVIEAMKVQKKLKGSDDHLHAKFWLSFGIDRKTTKRPVMVLPYGGTFHSCREYVQQWYVETSKARGLDLPDFKTMGSRCHYLSKKIWEGIEICVGLSLINI